MRQKAKINMGKLNRLDLLFDALKPARKTRILDVGASPIHTPPYHFLLQHGACEVYGFEPDERSYGILNDRDNPSETYFPFAAGDGNTHELRICKERGFTSLLEPKTKFQDYVNHFRHGMAVIDRIPMKTVRIDDIDELPLCDLFKIDIQGGETMVFKHANKQLDHMSAVITEAAFIELYEDQPLFDEQMRSLRVHDLHLFHFQTVQRISLRGPRQSVITSKPFMRNQITDGDAVFVRQVDYDSSLPSEQLKHLAIVADQVFSGHSLSIRAMEVLEQRGKIKSSAFDQYCTLLANEGA